MRSAPPGAGGQLGYDRDGHLFTANASLGEKLRIGVNANNLFNNDHAAFRQTAQPYGVYYNAAKPRTYGMQLEYISKFVDRGCCIIMGVMQQQPSSCASAA